MKHKLDKEFNKDQPVVTYRLRDSLIRFLNKIQIKRGRIPVVHAFTGYGSTKGFRVLGRVFLQKRYDNPLSIYRGIRVLAAFAVVPKVELEVFIDGKPLNRTTRSDENGYIDANFRIALKPGEHKVCFKIIDDLYYKVQEQTELSTGKILIYKSEGSVGVICDFDDTVIRSNLRGWVRAIWLALFSNPRKRKMVPGMSRFMQLIREIYPNSFFIYVSTTAWNMSYYIKRFLVANNLPFGPCVLRDWGPEEDRAFTSGKQHKTESIKSLFRRYPESKWILIGDNGQHDPEIYGDLFQAYQKKIQRIIIREFTNKPRSKKLLVSKERTQARVIYGFDGYALSNSFLNDFKNLLK